MPFVSKRKSLARATRGAANGGGEQPPAAAAAAPSRPCTGLCRQTCGLSSDNSDCSRNGEGCLPPRADAGSPPTQIPRHSETAAAAAGPPSLTDGWHGTEATEAMALDRLACTLPAGEEALQPELMEDPRAPSLPRSRKRRKGRDRRERIEDRDIEHLALVRKHVC